jgi:LCP family protein required for cell wall assembly
MTDDNQALGNLTFEQQPLRRRRRTPRRFKRLHRVYRRVVPSRLRRWIRRNPALAWILGLFLALLLIICLWLLWLWLHLHQAAGFEADLGRDRPPVLTGGENILLVGLDCDEEAPAADQLRTCSDNDGDVDLSRLGAANLRPTGVRSDVIMVLHLTADGRHAQVISIPRDSYVDVDGHGRTKINAAFSYGGPNLLGRTIEQNFHVHLTHMIVTDFGGFRGITEAIGGVQVYVPEDVVDDRTGTVSWHKGWQTIEGERALDYVRTRHGLARGDFDRVQRHLYFLRAVIDRTRTTSVLANPLRVSKLVSEITSHVAMDNSLTDREVMKLATTGLHLRLGDTAFVTVPYQGSATVGGQSVVLLKMKQAIALFDAVQRDQFQAYVADHTIDTLPPESQVK